MRIGQLARKYTINQDEVILFLNEVQAELSPFHHNSKISSDIEDLVIGHFSLSPKVVEEATDETSEEIPAETDEQELNSDIIKIEQDKKTEADLQQELDPTLPPIKTPTIEKVDEKSIDTDSLMELLESDEASNDLSKITHIKAPKKELSGLKVVGKIELTEPKSKSVDKSEHPDKKPKPVAYNRQQGQQLRDEERTNRRLKVKEQKEQYEARQEKRRIAEEKKKKKAQNKAHYDKKIQKTSAAHTKEKIRKEEIEPEVTDQLQAAKPIGIFDWFWKLFNL